MAAPEKKKLKILCIHGYRQNAQTFREKTGSLRKMFKKHVDFTYITAPHKVPPGNMGSAAWEGADEHKAVDNGVEAVESDSAGEMGWWFSRTDDYFKSTDYSDISKGFDESVQLVTDALEKEAERDGGHGFDGILGFSQGGCLVSMLCAMQSQQNKNWFRFAILIASFKSRSSNLNVYYQPENKCDIPSLHVYGDTDRIVATPMSEELLDFFQEPKTLRHPGGHFVPAAGPQKKEYLEFLDAMAKLCL